MQLKSSFKLFLPILLSILLINCSLVYRPDVIQGNYLDESKYQQLQIGMTKEQVVYLFGEPLVNNLANDDIWNYVFSHKHRNSHTDMKSLNITFNKNGQVESFSDLLKK